MRIGNGLAVSIDAFRPVHSNEAPRDKILSPRSIQNKEVAIPGSLRQHLAGLAFERSIEQHRRFDVVPIVCVMR